MIATSGFLTALECIKFVFGRRRRSAPDATSSGVFTLYHSVTWAMAPFEL